jgi:uncharacterized membrane protein YhaH (DUF805 family)
MMRGTYVWVGNMSATSFAELAIPGNSNVLKWAILGVFVLFLALALYMARARPRNLTWAYLFLACTIGAMIIPATSHDYKLPLLIAPVILLLDSITLAQPNSLLKGFRIACLVLCSAAFGSTLFPYTNKIFIPGIGDTPVSLLVQNNLPALMAVLMGFAFLVFTQPPDPDTPSDSAMTALPTV